MPTITELGISQFRNMDSVSINPSPQVNLIYGQNGSGKTSILEAISVLAHGRSFRTHKYRRLIKDEARQFMVFGKIMSHEDIHLTTVGVQRTLSGDYRFRINGANIYTSGELAQLLPLQVIDAHSFLLLEGTAKVRRQFFDWLVFHVKQDFRDAWKDYARSIKQRNSLLRRDKISYFELDPWDTEISRLGARIQELRSQVFNSFVAALQARVSDWSHVGLPEGKKIQVIYQDGWKSPSMEGGGGTLQDQYRSQLRANFDRDRKLGYTSLGSHKSDIRILIDNIPAVEILSRGQQKMLIACMFMSEVEVYQQTMSRSAIFLLDDLPAELDRQRLTTLASRINALQSQVFITGVEADSLISTWPDIQSQKLKLFHVKHGIVTEETGTRS